MVDSVTEEKNKIRRSIGLEFVRMEDDFDVVRDARFKIVDKVMAVVDNIKITDDNNEVTESGVESLKVLQVALKALNDVEVGNTRAVTLKLKNQEMEMNAAQNTKDRIAIVLQATAPGRIQQTFPKEDLDKQLEEMFGEDIQDFELKTNSRDLG